jgi:preprotein translocase subunit YajC
MNTSLNSPLAQELIMIAAMVAIFYFIVIRPQQQQKRKQEELLLGIKKGDEIVTAGGLVGEVLHIKTQGADGAATLDDRVTVRSGESRVVVERGRIARVGAAGGATAGSTKIAASSSAS